MTNESIMCTGASRTYDYARFQSVCVQMVTPRQPHALPAGSPWFLFPPLWPVAGKRLTHSVCVSSGIDDEQLVELLKLEFNFLDISFNKSISAEGDDDLYDSSSTDNDDRRRGRKRAGPSAAHHIVAFVAGPIVLAACALRRLMTLSCAPSHPKSLI